MLYLDFSREPGQWVPNKFSGRENLDAIDFLRRFNEVTHEAVPGSLIIAEESTSWPMTTKPVYMGGLGFDLKWNMGWMHDMLSYTEKDPVFRRFHQNQITFSLMYAFTKTSSCPLAMMKSCISSGRCSTKCRGTPGANMQFACALWLYDGASGQETFVYGSGIWSVV